MSNQFGIPNQTDVFAVAANGALDVVGGDPWNGPAQIGPPVYPIITERTVEDMGRFIEVTGKWFTPNATVSIDYNIRENGPNDQIGQDMVTSDGKGKFVHAIPVNFLGDLQWVVLKATDLASGATGNVSNYS